MYLIINVSFGFGKTHMKLVHKLICFGFVYLLALISHSALLFSLTPFLTLLCSLNPFLATLVALHFTPVSK